MKSIFRISNPWIILFLLIPLYSCNESEIVSPIIVRYNTDGKIDTSFGKEGVVRPKLGDYGVIYALQAQRDDKILAAATSNYQFTLIRLNKDGDLDEGFANKGIFSSSFGSKYGLFKDLIIQTDGRILTTGLFFSKVEEISYFVLARFNPNGTPDITFGEGGKVVTSDFAYDDSIPYTIKVDSKERILIGGKINSYAGIVRYDKSGYIDYTFGDYGFVYANIYPEGESPCDILITENQDIVFAGASQNLFFIARLDEYGKIYMEIETPIVDQGYFETRDVLIQKDGSVLLAGLFSNYNTPSSLGIVKLTPDGKRDPSFGSKGIVKLTPHDLEPNYLNSIYEQSDGKILAAGSSTHDLAIIRLNKDGSIDEGFGNNGIITTDLGAEEVANSIIVQSDGKIIVGGYSDTSSGKF